MVDLRSSVITGAGPAVRSWPRRKHSRAAGAKRLKVGVLVPNERAHAFYRACGFRDFSVQLVKTL